MDTKTDYGQKYLKYKEKYLELKKYFGGFKSPENSSNVPQLPPGSSILKPQLPPGSSIPLPQLPPGSSTQTTTSQTPTLPTSGIIHGHKTVRSKRKEGFFK